MDRAALPPTWFEELAEVLQTRRRLAVAVAIAIAVLGVLVTLVAPGVLPSTAGVGAAVGVAACLLAVAAVIGVDAGDLRVRGARHVRAAGADVAVVLDGEPTGPGATAVVDRLDGLGIRRVSFVPAADTAHTDAVALVDGLAEAWARRGRRVLVLDLTRPDDAHAGIVDVARGEVALGQAVRFDPDLMLARLGAGRDLETALVELPALAPRLPTDIERMLVALPSLSDPAARAGAAALDDVLVLARTGRTSRVDLLATLEGLDVAGVRAAVLLHRPDVHLPTPQPPAPEADPAEAPAPAEPAAQEPAAEALPADRLGADEQVADGPPGDTPAADGASGDGVAAPPGAVAGAPARADEDDDEDDDEDEDDPTQEIVGGPDAPGPSPDTAAPRPALAARERVADDLPEAPGRSRGTTAGATGGGLLGLAEIDRDVERESAEAADARPAEPPAARTLRAVVSGDGLGATPGRHDAGDGAADVPPGHDDALRTAAVLETLAQEIWSRDDLGGTA